MYAPYKALYSHGVAQNESTHNTAAFVFINKRILLGSRNGMVTATNDEIAMLVTSTLHKRVN